MYKCDICGREMFKKNRCYGYNLCKKHMHQFRKYGRFLDSNPRTQNDLNEYRIKGKVTEFDVYNQRCDVVDHFIIDTADLEKVKYHKWRRDTNNHIITGNSTNKTPRRELSHIIVGVVPDDKVVDHINHDPRDNRKSNLRICSQADNICNRGYMSNSSSGWQGIHWEKSRGKWSVEIEKDDIRYRLGRFSELSEAVFVRTEAEKILFREYRPTNRDSEIKSLTETIPVKRQQGLSQLVQHKINLRQSVM